jgi:hypothetical protein
MCRDGDGHPPMGRTIDINHRPTGNFNWGGGGPGSITGRNDPMCTTGGGEGGQKTKRQADRWYQDQADQLAKEQRDQPWRGWTGYVLERLVGHAFAAVLRRRMTLAQWWAYETDLDAHQPDCRYRRLIERFGAST